ncbi:MAG: amidohydrolase family protein [Proteobacteria bacterium]|nr:amidohydrolase family protein [Pseudomonadota bacterium]
MNSDQDCIITSSTLMTLDDALGTIEDGAIAVVGGRIATVGSSAEIAKAHPELSVIDGRGKVVLPGIINSHTHCVLLVLRGTVEDMSGDAIFGYMTPISFAMTDAERRALARLGCLEAIRSGTTTLVEPFRFITGYGDGMVESGLRLYLGENAADALTLKIRHGIYEFDRGFGQEFLDRTVAMIEKFHGAEDGRVQCQISAHAPDVCSPWMLDQLNMLASKHNLTRTVHLSQSPKELKQVRDAHDRTSAEYLDDNGWLGPDVIGAHWTYCTEADIRLLAERGVHMAHCPANSSRRGPHKVLAHHIIDAGVNIVLGTDNMTEDMFQAMKIGSIVHRGASGGGVSPGPMHALRAATINGARALGREGDIGTLTPGKRADLTILDLSHPSLRPVINLASNIVHYGHPGVVSSVMVEGRFLMRDGKMLSMNEADVIAEAQAATLAAWRRLAEISPDIELPQSMQG